MIECQRIQELLERGAGIDPTADGFDEVARHAAACPDCAARLREFRRAEETVRAGFRWADPGPGFTARVMRDITAPRPRRRLPLAAAAAVLVAVGALLAVFSARESGLRPARLHGDLRLATGGRVDRAIPTGTGVRVAGAQAALEMVPGVGFALRPESVFRLSPTSARGYTRLELEQGGAAVSVKTAGGSEKLEVVLDGLSVLTHDADFLVETRSNGDRPALYVDRGRVIVGFGEGVSVVESGEHVELVPAMLLSRVRSGEARLKADLATLEAQCDHLRRQVARCERDMRTYSVRLMARKDELAMAQEARVFAADKDAARELEEAIRDKTAQVETLDFMLGEIIEKMSSLRSRLPERLAELRRKRALAMQQKKKFKEGLALLAALR
jgi:hypothetical protein